MAIEKYSTITPQSPLLKRLIWCLIIL